MKTFLKIHAYGHSGFGTMILLFLSNCAYWLKEGEIPYMDASTVITSYHGNNIGLNIWTQFFQQETITKKDKVRLALTEHGVPFGVHLGPYPLPREREVFHNAYSTFLKVRPHILKKVERFVKSNFLGKKVLGLHIRGTDTLFDRSRPSLPLKYYIDLLNFYFESQEYDSVFLLSDQQHTINTLKEAFPRKIITYDCKRIPSTGINSLIYRKESDWIVQNKFTKGSGYRRGENVLVEILILSQVSLLLKTVSQMSTLSIVINNKLPYVNLDIDFLGDDRYTCGSKKSPNIYFNECKFNKEVDLTQYVDLIIEWENNLPSSMDSGLIKNYL